MQLPNIQLPNFHNYFPCYGRNTIWEHTHVLTFILRWKLHKHRGNGGIYIYTETCHLYIFQPFVARKTKNYSLKKPRLEHEMVVGTKPINKNWNYFIITCRKMTATTTLCKNKKTKSGLGGITRALYAVKQVEWVHINSGRRARGARNARHSMAKQWSYKFRLTAKLRQQAKQHTQTHAFRANKGTTHVNILTHIYTYMQIKQTWQPSLDSVSQQAIKSHYKSRPMLIIIVCIMRAHTTTRAIYIYTQEDASTQTTAMILIAPVLVILRISANRGVVLLSFCLQQMRHHFLKVQ